MFLPQRVIEDIRKYKFGLGFDLDNISEEIRKYMDENRKFKEDAARLVSDIFTEKPHFILELIQNAEDNKYSKYTVPKTKIIIDKDIIILQNNEKGFDEKNAWSLCSIGNSTKKNRAYGYIGEKGIGFKSVFMVSDEPHIFSNGFSFRFKYVPSDPASIIIPEWIDNIKDFVDLQVTNIVLPLKDRISDISELVKIDPCLLLFLKKLKSIEIDDRVGGNNYTIARKDINGKVNILSKDGTNSWKLVNSRPLMIPDYIKEERRAGIVQTGITLAFPVTASNNENLCNQKVFAFLPVKSYGFKFVIQADFLLTPSRDEVHKEKTWNKWLSSCVPNLFFKAFDIFKKDNLVSEYYEYIPLANEVTDSLFTSVVKDIHVGLLELRCILSENGHWLTPSEILTANEEIRRILPNKDLKSFFNKEYISKDLIIKDDIIDLLGIKAFEMEHLFVILQNTEWLAKKDFKWFTELYAYLGRCKIEIAQVYRLKKLKIVMLESGKLASTSEGNIFFGLHKNEGYGFENELRICKRALLNVNQKKKEEIITFLRLLGVCEAKPFDIIENHILPIYENLDWKQKDAKTKLGYIRYIKDNISAYEKEKDKYINGNKNYLDKRDDPLKRLKESLLIHLKKVNSNENYYWQCFKIYCSKEYGDSFNLESLFGNINGVYFVHAEYIENVTQVTKMVPRVGNSGVKSDINLNKRLHDKKWKSFFLRLGLNTGFIIENTSDNYLTYDEKSKLENWTANSPVSITNWNLKPLQELLTQEGDLKYALKRAQGIVDLLQAQWGLLEDKKKLKYQWYYQRKSSVRYFDSTWIHLLKESRWLPATDGKLYRPDEMFIANREIKKILGNSVPYLKIQIKNGDLVRSLGINTQVNVRGALGALQNLVTNKCTDKAQFFKLYEFINENYKNSPVDINESFLTNKLIFIPDTKQLYFSSMEVLWKDVSEIFGDNRCYLENVYKEIRPFFVDKLNISYKPTIKDYAKVLIDLGKRSETDAKDEKVVLKIYQALNEYLNPRNNDFLQLKNDWWDDFINGKILWTDKKEFRKRDQNVYVNDNIMLYNLFKNQKDITFMKLPKFFYPQIYHFLNGLNIPYLSIAVKKVISVKKDKIFRQTMLTMRLKEYIPFIIRYLYQFENDTYYSLKREGVIDILASLDCYSVEEIKVEYWLREQFVFDSIQVYIEDGHLYVREANIEDTDYLALEISRLLENPKGLDNFLITLFDKNTKEKIEMLMRVKGINELPSEEEKWLNLKLNINKNEDDIGGITDFLEQSREEVDTDPITDENLDNSQFNSPSYNKHDEDNKQQALKNKWEATCRPDEADAKTEIYYPSPDSSGRRNFSNNTTSQEDKDKKPLINEKSSINKNSTASYDIGRWGEGYVLKCLRKKYLELYPECRMEKSKDGFDIVSRTGTIVNVLWLNKYEDSGIGHDIKVVSDGCVDYIEVKSTTTETKEWFDMTAAQWEFAREKGDKFYIYRVYNAGTKQAYTIYIHNPYKLWKEGELEITPVRIKI